MFYTKNVPSIERVVRVVVGIAFIVWGLFGMLGSWLIYVVVGSGIFVVMTGFVGFCPMCALAGRRIKQNIKNQDKEAS